MFIMPKDEKEVDRISVNDNEITIKSYGLPMIFWGYLAAVLTVIFAMVLAIKGPIVKLYQTNDPINMALAIAVILTIAAIVIFLLGFFFYEKFISKKEKEIRVTHRIFWIPIISKKYSLISKDALEIKHYLDSPNVAKISNDQSLKGFENRGYFQLFATLTDKSEVLIDRSSQKRDLVRTSELLTKY